MPTQDVLVGGHRLEYAWHGPGPAEAPTLVFLHEGLGSVSTWKDFPQSVGEETGLGVLVYSRLGYGGSDPVALPRTLSYMHEEGERGLPALLDALGVRVACLVGHSDGASIALVHAATDTRGRVKGLALLAPHVFVEDISIKSIEAAREAFLAGDLAERLRRHHGPNTACAFWGWNRAWLDPGFRAWNLEGYLPKIEVPVLLLQGEDDEYGTTRQVEAIERGVAGPVELRLLERCGHAPQRDQEERTRQEIGRFARGIFPDGTHTGPGTKVPG